MGQQSLEPMGVVAHDAAMPTMQVMQDERLVKGVAVVTSVGGMLAGAGLA